MLVEQSAHFYSALVSQELSKDIPDCFDIYGRLIGSWALEVYDYQRDGVVRRSAGEVHFARVLEGRAVQLVWIIPRRSGRESMLAKDGNRYGTTLCIWDNSIQAWQVTWVNPVTGVRDELIARQSGSDIAQIGRHADGTPVRWNFTQITPDSFLWTGEALNPDGETWRREVEFHAMRT